MELDLWKKNGRKRCYMRPRLPLCLLPFVGAAAFVLSTGITQASVYTIENYMAQNSHDGSKYLYSYGFNINSNRQNVSNSNVLTDESNTFTFVVNNYDGDLHGHTGGGTFLSYFIPITLSAKGGDNVTAGDYGNIIGINGTLTINSRYNGTAPVDYMTHATDELVPPLTWTYVSQMGFASTERSTNSTLVIDFSNNSSVANQNFVISSKGPDQNLTVYGIYGYNGDIDTTPTYVLQNPRPSSMFSEYDLKSDTDSKPANFNVANVSISGGNTKVIYADESGQFVVGRENAKNTFLIQNNATFILKNAAYAHIHATTIVNNGYLVVEGADTAHTGGYTGGISGTANTGVTFNDVYVAEIGAMYIHLDSVTFAKTLNIVDGGAAIFTSSNFTVKGETLVAGYAEKGYDRSTLVIGGESNNGIFAGKVTVRDFGILRVEGQGTIMQNGLEFGSNGILVLGAKELRRDGALINPENGLTVLGSLVFGQNSRVEVSTLNRTNLNNQQNAFQFNNSIYFAIYKPYEQTGMIVDPITGLVTYTYGRVPEGNIPYTGNIQLSNNATLNWTYAITTSNTKLDTSGDGDYNMAGIISGQGNLNLIGKSGKTRYTLSGNNTYTGNTSITIGILEITNETYSGGTVISSSLGSGNGKIIFANDPSWYTTPALALSEDYNGTASWTTPAELHRDMQIGSSASGSAVVSAMLIAGRYDVVSDTGNGTTTENFASNVIIHGNITQVSGMAGTLVKAGDGKITIDGKASYTGGTFITDGTLAVLQDDTLHAKTVIVFDDPGKVVGAGMTSILPTLELGQDMTKLVNTIQLSDHGRIDATGVTGNYMELTGNIVTPATSVVYDRVLELYSDDTDGVIKLSGDIAVRNSTIKFLGKELILGGNVIGSETIFDLSGKAATSQATGGEFYNTDFDNAYGAANLIFDTTNAKTAHANGQGKYTAFMAKLIGANDIVKTGKNDLILASDFSDGASYTGDTIVEDGSLIMYGGGKLRGDTTLVLERDISTGSKGTFNVNGTNQVVGKLLGGGTLATDYGSLSVNDGHAAGESFDGNMTGNGTLAINNVFNYAGLAADDPDRLDHNLFTGKYLINDGGILTTEVTNVLSSNAEMNLAGSNAQWVLTGTSQNINILNSDQSGAIIDFGTGQGTVTSLVIGTLYDEEKEGVPSGKGVYQGQIIGDGSLTKQGSGTFKFANTSLSYTGDTMISEGTLELDTVNLINSYVEVEDYGRLLVDVTNGDSSIKNIYVSGILEMNGSAHDFNVDRMTLDSATLKLGASIIGFDEATEYNLGKASAINISGIVEYNPGSEKNIFELDLEAGNWGHKNGTHLEIFRANLTNINDIEDNFGVEDDYVFLKLTMSQQGWSANDTMITVDVERETKVTFANVTGHSFASILDDVDVQYRQTDAIGGRKDTVLTRIMDEFYVMRDVNEVIRATKSLSGSSAYILPTAELEEFRRHVNTVRNRATTIGLRAPNMELRDEQYNVWALGTGSHSSLSSDGDVPGYDKDTWGGMIGFDTAVSSSLAWGLSFSYAKSDIKVDNGDKVDIDNYYFDGFVRYQESNWNFLGIATVGLGSGDTERHIKVGDYSGTGRGTADSLMISLYGEVGYDFLLENNWIAQPFASVALGNYHNDGYSESGLGDAGLKVDSMDHFVSRIGAGARAIHFFDSDAFEQVGRLEFRALVTQDLSDVSPDVSRSLINGGTRYTDVPGSGMGKTAFEIGASIQVPVAYDVFIFADISGEFRTKQSSVFGDIGVRITF